MARVLGIAGAAAAAALSVVGFAWYAGVHDAPGVLAAVGRALAGGRLDLALPAVLGAATWVSCLAVALHRTAVLLSASGRVLIVRGRSPSELYAADPADPSAGVIRLPGLGGGEHGAQASRRETLRTLLRPVVVWRSPLGESLHDLAWIDLVVAVPMAMLALGALWVCATYVEALLRAVATVPDVALSRRIATLVAVACATLGVALALQITGHWRLAAQGRQVRAQAAADAAACRDALRPGSRVEGAVVSREIYQTVTGPVELEGIESPKVYTHVCFLVRIDATPVQPLYLCRHVDDPAGSEALRLDGAMRSGTPIPCAIAEDYGIEPA